MMAKGNESDKICSCSFCSDCDCSTSSIKYKRILTQRKANGTQYLKNNLSSLNTLTQISIDQDRSLAHSSLCLSILVNCFLLATVLLLSILCLMKQLLLKLPRNLGGVIAVAFVIVCVCCFYFNTNLLTNYFDPFYTLITNKGVRCENNVYLNFISSLNANKEKTIYQVEILNSSVSPVKAFCQQIDGNNLSEHPEIGLIESKRVEYGCSNFKYNFDPSSSINKEFPKSFVESVSNLLANENVNELAKILPEIKHFISNNIVEECTQQHRKCFPSIPSKQISMNINNQMIFELKHCYCDMQMYNCLKRSFKHGDSNANRIGDVYFNLLAVKCFRYEYRPQCNLFVLGTCIHYGNSKCFAKAQHSPKF